MVAYNTTAECGNVACLHVLGEFLDKLMLIITKRYIHTVIMLLHVITDNFHHLLMKFHIYVRTHFYTPNDKNKTANVKFYHLL